MYSNTRATKKYLISKKLDALSAHVSFIEYICITDKYVYSNRRETKQYLISKKISKGAKIKNRYNQVPNLTQDINGKVTNSHLETTNERKEVRCYISSCPIY